MAAALAWCLPSSAHAGMTAAHLDKTRNRTHAFRIQHGVLTIDGLTVKTALNLRAAHMRYLFIYLPGEGTAVIGEEPFSGATPQPAAFHGNMLTVLAGGRRLQLTASNRLRGTRTAYVRFEPGAGPGTRLPALNLSESAMIPAVWPEMDAGGSRSLHRVHGHRLLRSAKLCRPSPHGGEQCATIREVQYRPY